MSKKILHKRSLVANTIPTTSELDLGELGLNAYEGRLYVKRSYLDSLGDPVEDIIQIGGRVPVENTLFVTEGGDDTREGTSWEESFASIEKAVEVADALGGTYLIDVGPGTYYTQGHIDIPDNCVVKCVHRTVRIKPVVGYEERNVFRLGSGCFVEGFLIEGFRVDDMDNPTEGFAISFRPGAVITRAPYAHKVAVRSIPTWEYIAPPLDRNNANPLAGVGGGVVLADGSVCSPYSIFPNIMTWGATPVVHNGIGYCAKKGALINAVNAVSLWAHKHFYAIDGGQIILSACSTQFGDYTMVAKGSRNLVSPVEILETQLLDPVKPSNTATLTVQTAAAAAILANKATLITNMWNALVAEGLVTGWTLAQENFTKRDAGTLLGAIVNTLNTANESYITNFLKSLYNNGTAFFPDEQIPAFVFSYNNLRDQIVALTGVNNDSDVIVTEIVHALTTTVELPQFISGPALSVQSAAYTAISNAKTTIVNNMWNALVADGYTTGWTAEDEVFTKRDGGTFLQCILWVLQSANEKPMMDFAKGLFDTVGGKVYTPDKESAFIYAFNFMREQINLLPDVNNTSDLIVDGLTTALINTITNPILRIEPSTITAIGHTWTGVLAGVALTKIPPVRNQANIRDSILELDSGLVIASGQDDQGSAIFVGGMEINSDTGELSGPPFEQAVNRIATKIAISRSF